MNAGKFLAACAGASLALVSARPAFATSVVPMSNQEMARRADLVAVGEVVSVSMRREPYLPGQFNQTTRTFTKVKISDVWKGSLKPGATVDVLDPGGLVDGRGFDVEGTLGYQAGERVVLFLNERRGHPGQWLTVGAFLGQLTVVEDEQGATKLARIKIPLEERGQRFHPEAQVLDGMRLDAFEPFARDVKDAIAGRPPVGLETPIAVAPALDESAASLQSQAAFLDPPRYFSPYRHWIGTQMPITVHFGNAVEANLSNATAVQQFSLALGAWAATSCTNLVIDTTSVAPSAAYQVGFQDDGVTEITFGDPANELGNGVLGRTSTPFNTGETETLNGTVWNQIKDFDIVFSSSDTYVTHGDAGTCSGFDIDFFTVAVHEIGHGLGFAHSCESSEVACASVPGNAQAVMFWVINFCQFKDPTTQYDINQDSLSYARGGLLDFAGNVTQGGTPLTVNYSTTSVTSSNVASLTWHFGDGTTDTSATPSHNYPNEGVFSVSVDASGTPASCPAYTQNIRKTDYIKACDFPTNAFHFTVTGKTVKFTPETPLSACPQNFDWDFGDGTAHGVARTPTHTYLAGGTYTVSLIVTGLTGAPTAVTHSVTTGGDKKKGCSCSLEPEATANTGAAIATLAIALAVSITVSRRRRNA